MEVQGLRWSIDPGPGNLPRLRNSPSLRLDVGQGAAEFDAGTI